MFCLNGPNHVNGPNVWLARHLPALREEGLEPEILYTSEQLNEPCQYLDSLEKSGIPCRKVRLTFFAEVNVQAILEAIQKDPPDVFVPNLSVPGYLCVQKLRESGIQTIGIFHSDDPDYHDIVDFFVRGKPHWQLSGMVGVSNYLNELLQASITDGFPILFAPYGVPVPEKTCNWQSDHFKLFYFGRFLEYQKRISRVITCMANAATACNKITGVLHGEGDKEPLEILLSRLPGGSKVSIGSSIPFPLIQKTMLTGQAFILLSDFEGFSIALMEAMACGLVPIVSRIKSGISDIIVQGENGFIIESDDIQGFSNAACSLANDEHLWRRLSANARNSIIVKDITSQSCARRWASFLREKIGERKQKTPVQVPSIFDIGKDLPPEIGRHEGYPYDVFRYNSYFPLRSKILAATKPSRPLYLWGASLAGEQLFSSLSNLPVPILGFIDSDKARQNKHLHGVPVFSPEQLRAQCQHPPLPYVVIASLYDSEIGSILEGFGLQRDRDFCKLYETQSPSRSPGSISQKTLAAGT